MTPSRKLHQNDKLWGAVAEALIAAYALRSEGGKLSSYRPFTDVDGKNIVIDLVGGGSRTSTSRSSAPLASTEMVGGTVRRHRDRIPSSPKFVFIFCLLDRIDNRFGDAMQVRCRPSSRNGIMANAASFHFDDEYSLVRMGHDKIGLPITTVLTSIQRDPAHVMKHDIGIV